MGAQYPWGGGTCSGMKRRWENYGCYIPLSFVGSGYMEFNLQTRNLNFIFDLIGGIGPSGDRAVQRSFNKRQFCFINGKFR